MRLVAALGEFEEARGGPDLDIMIVARQASSINWSESRVLIAGLKAG